MKAEKPYHQEHAPLKQWWGEMVVITKGIFAVFGFIFTVQYLIKGIHLIQSWVS